MTRNLVLFTFVLLMKAVTAIGNGDMTNSLSERDIQRRGLFDNLPNTSNITQYMLEAHNRFRAYIAGKYNVDKMNKLVYDSSIAQKAQAWANTCQYTANSQNAYDRYSENRAFKISGTMVELLHKIFDESNYDVHSSTCAPYNTNPYCNNYLNLSIISKF